MKNLFFISIFLLSANTFSSTKNIGDSVQYEMSFQGIKATSETTITSLNRSSEEFEVKTTTVVQGQVETTTERVPQEDIMTKETAAYMLENCKFMGGLIEQIFLINKNHTTCKLQVESDSVRPMLERSGIKLSNKTNGFVWIGAFPINGIGKLDTADVSMNLTGMSW
ncbi:hypothetical protein [Halobacteriovorax sp. HLS]|uniref:hypothetical protein n=1 Tax=Halobacteriovorax sp. HLS TaxID=2234000 RepID=UPI000FDC5C81|nr:hypothetical protein [Halobacteriovorax sp. HLS]